MRMTKRRQKNQAWSGLDDKRKTLAKQRRLYVASNIYPAGRYLLEKARTGR